MDNLTHTLIGVGLSRAGFSEKFGKGTTMVLAVASNLPDLDIFLPAVTGEPSFAIRRMVTHSLFTFPILAVLGALVFKRIYSHQNFKNLFGLCFLGMGLHVFFDLLNSYGVVALWPFSRQRFELAWVFIIDLLIWALLLTPLLFGKWITRLVPPQRMYQGFMMAVAIYVGFCGLAHFRSSELFREWAEKENQHPTFSYAFPEAFGGHRFRGVLRENDRYTILLANVLSGSVQHVGSTQTEATSPAARACMETELGKKLTWFEKAPVWQQDKETGLWQVYDLRFKSAVLDRKTPFVYSFNDC